MSPIDLASIILLPALWAGSFVLQRVIVLDMGVFPMHHVVPRFSATPGSIRAPAPSLGQHNREVLRLAGVDDAGYSALLGEGVIAEEGAAVPGDDA